MALRPQINVRLPESMLAEIENIMEEKGISHLSDYIRQLVTADIRRALREQYATGKEDPEFQEWLKQRRTTNKKKPGGK
jgi:Arc/MetJ-type ribon-helix-helix transcriptional regulator